MSSARSTSQKQALETVAEGWSQSERAGETHRTG